MRRFVQAVTPLRGSCGVAVSGFEEKGDADDQQHVYCWTRPHACVSVPERRRHGSGGLQRPGSSDFPGDDSLVITPTSFLRSRPRGGFLDFPLLRHHRADPWLGRPGGSIPPRPRRKPSRRDLRPAHIHGPMQIAGTDGTAPSQEYEKGENGVRTHRSYQQSDCSLQHSSTALDRRSQRARRTCQRSQRCDPY